MDVINLKWSLVAHASLLRNDLRGRRAAAAPGPAEHDAVQQRVAKLRASREARSVSSAPIEISCSILPDRYG